MSSNHFTTLRNDHLLFQKLKNESPSWWQFIKENIKSESFYVDVRKDNSLNVYYNGGSLLKVTISRGSICCKIHEFYLGKTGSQYLSYDPNYLSEDVDKIKTRIASRYSDTSENGIKARLICNPNANYIDSEFAYPEIVGKIKDKHEKEVNAYKTTRIDLTKLENGKIVFVELKRIQDRRLFTNEYERGKPEILDQMEAYLRFIKAHKEEITVYYKTLFSIKRSLGILPKSMINITNIDDYKLGENVELYIEPYTDLNTKRIRRIEAIKTILDNNNIVHNL